MTAIETTTLHGGPDFEVALPADSGALAPTRREVARRLGAHGMRAETIETVLLVVSELCTNAIQATGRNHTPIGLRVLIGEAAVTVDVLNFGPPFDALGTITPGEGGTSIEGGRGLAIVRAVSDDTSVRFHDGRCTVRAIIAPTR